MNTQLIFLAGSVARSVIEIVLLLLAAGIIGYVTAWFYARSVYTPVIQKLEDEKAGLIDKVNELEDDITKLEGKIKKMNEEIAEMGKTMEEKEKELESLRKKK
jgi:peptidoglycan hydrolase CwlO-like protein